MATNGGGGQGSAPHLASLRQAVGASARKKSRAGVNPARLDDTVI
jgi:hypothetical protein